MYPLANQTLLKAGTTAVQFYENNASVTTETTTGSYVVTVSNWTTIQNIYTESFSTPAEQATFVATYQKNAQNYKLDNPDATLSDAGAYALMTMFPGAINVFYEAPNSSSYVPVIIETSNGVTVLIVKPC